MSSQSDFVAKKNQCRPWIKKRSMEYKKRGFTAVYGISKANTRI